MKGYIYLLLASLGWSGLDFCRKKLASELNPVVLVVLFCLGQVLTFGIWSFFDWRSPTSGYYLPALISVLINSFASIMFIRALRFSGLSNTVPLLSLTPAIAGLIAIPLLHEYPQPFEVFGMCLIVLGAFGLNIKTKLSQWWSGIWDDRGARIMLGVALLWPISAVCDKLAFQQANPAVHSFLSSIGIVLVLLCVAFGFGAARLKDFKVAPDLRFLVIGAAICSSCGYGFQALGYQAMHIGLFEAFKRAISLLMTLASGYWIFQEEMNLFKVGSVILMVCGVITMEADLVSQLLGHSALPR